MTSIKCIEYCRGLNNNYTLAVLESTKCSCGTNHTLDMHGTYRISKTKCIKSLSGWNEVTMVGNDNETSGSTIAMYNIQQEVNRYHGDKYGSSTCHAITRELMITRYG